MCRSIRSIGRLEGFGGRDLTLGDQIGEAETIVVGIVGERHLGLPGLAEHCDERPRPASAAVLGAARCSAIIPAMKLAPAVAAVVVALLAAEGASAACTLAKIADLPTTMIAMRPLVTAKVNGVDERFLIDSGAFFSTISPGAAAEMKLGLRPAPFGLIVTGLGGAAQASVTKVREFTLAGVPLHNIDFLVAGSDFGVAGMIGQNVLGLGDVEYDLANGVVRLMRPSGCGFRPLGYWAKPTQTLSTVDIRFDNPRLPLATTEVYVNGVRLRALFDTGAGQSILSRSAAARAGVSIDGAGVVGVGQGSGIGRRRYRVWIAPVDDFKIGDEEIKHTKLVIADTSIESADMLIGPDFFLSHHVYVAKSQSKIYFTYNGGPVFNLTTPPPDTTEPAAPATVAASGAAAGKPLDAAALSRRGAAFASRRQFDPAIADLTRAVDLAPKEEDYVYERALAYLGAGKPFLAMADLDQALTLKPDDARVLVVRAQLRFSGHDVVNAEKDLDTASAAVAKEADIRLTIAGGYDRANRLDRAIEQYSLWIAAHPADSRRPQALNGRCWARALLNRDLDQALSDCDEAHRASPRTGSFLDNRGPRSSPPRRIRQVDRRLRCGGPASAQERMVAVWSRPCQAEEGRRRGRQGRSRRRRRDQSEHRRRGGKIRVEALTRHSSTSALSRASASSQRAPTASRYALASSTGSARYAKRLSRPARARLTRPAASSTSRCRVTACRVIAPPLDSSVIDRAGPRAQPGQQRQTRGIAQGREDIGRRDRASLRHACGC